MARQLAHQWGFKADKDGRYDGAGMIARHRAGDAAIAGQTNPARADAYVRKLQAETALLEIKLAVQRAELSNTAEHNAAMVRAVTAAKNDLLAAGRRCAPECDMVTAAQAEAVIARAIGDALRHLAKWQPEEQPKQEG